MNSNNVSAVKIGYYILFFFLIITKTSMIFFYYKYIYNKKLGVTFKTILSNTLTSDNFLYDPKPDVENTIYPPFIEIYKKNISSENKLLKNNKKYITSISDIELSGIKFLGIALFITLVSLNKQEYIEDITVKTISKLGDLNIIIFICMIIVIFAIVASVYLFIKFFKMRKILSIKDDNDDLVLLKQGLLYQRLDAMKNHSSILNTVDPNSSSNSGSNNTYWDKLIALGKEDDNINIDGLQEKDLKKFYDNNKDIHMPAPFNGGDNKYEEVYKNTANIGALISLVSFILSVISLIVLYKRSQ